MTRQYHLHCSPGQVGGYALLPGDPGRCEALAAHLSDARLVASNREFTTWTGRIEDQEVSITSTGIGGASAAIAMEELCELGTHTVLRVGTCGAIQPSVRKGDLIIATSAVRDEGTSRQYVPIEVPAVASFDICSALLATVRASGVRFHTGIVHSKDSFHAQTRPDSMPIASTLHERWTAMQRSGVLASEMECAAIFTVAAVRSMRAGALLLCVNEPPYEPAIEELPLNDLVTCAVHALAKVIDADKNPRPAETSSAE